MTLILALGNVDQVVQVSDRLVTDEHGQHRVLPENKATIVTLEDSRLVCGYAGLARSGRFRASEWVTEALLEAASEDHTAYTTIQRFTEAATARFQHADVLGAARRHRALSVLFAGYNDTRPRAGPIAACVTNFQNFQSGQDEEPWDEFRATFWSPKADVDNPTWIQRIGMWPAMRPEDEPRLRRPLEERGSVATIVDVGVGLLREIAGRDTAGGTVGKEASSVVLPWFRPPEIAGGEFDLMSGFHPVGASETWRGVNRVISLRNVQMSLKDPSVTVTAKEGSGKPVAVQKVGRNKPCPCGSGKKYKRCCGG